MPDPAPNPLLEAALAYAARGWPVFPCNTENKQPLVAADKDPVTKAPIKGTGGVSKATTAPEQIKAWWKRWPLAMIGVAMGHNRCFALDFDPRTDPTTGEIFTLERLKAETEAQIGCALPASLAARTPSDGVHVYFLQPEGEPIRNRGNLPEHVDVRGLGGYVIAPPSVTADGRRYRWLHGNAEAEIAEAPAALIEVLRARKARPERKSPPPAPPAGGRGDISDEVDDAVRKYALAALDGECRAVRTAAEGTRNNQLNESALKIASLVAAGAIQATLARSLIEAAARESMDDEREIQATLDSGWAAGMSNPRDLREIAASARARSRRFTSGSSRPPDGSEGAGRSRPRSPDRTDDGKPSSREGGGGDDGRRKGPGRAGGDDLTRRCAFCPQTDLGNLERFLARYGSDFLYVEQWGWLAWDGKRWNRDMAMALLGHAVQLTMRAIQEEAELVKASGIPDEPLDLWDASQKAAHAEQQRGKLDRIVKKARGEITLLSDTIAKWGRTSESAGHINCIAHLAEARLSARPDDFDADPLQLNLQNGTLVFVRPEEGRGASFTVRGHRREDRITKICDAAHDPAAKCPLYDKFLEKVQPEADIRAFLDAWAGYNALGLADAQKMALFYGEGSNGKGVWINTLAHILGDYAWAAAIETFIDQGKYRKGSDASPDLAALAGRRMVYANEPEENSKFSDGLIKTLTSDEPIGGVRELMKPPFELLVTFTNTVSANTMPKIGTDHGIKRRMQVVPWGVIIPDEEQDLQLKAKLKGEASGILNRVIGGAIAYLTSGLPAAEGITKATHDYHEENDMLGQFLELCVAKAEGETVGAMQLHETYTGWQAWSGNLPATGKPWSMKHLNSQMRKKGFHISKSSTMRWHDIRMKRTADEFVDHEGKPRAEGLRPLPDDEQLERLRDALDPSPAPPDQDDDDFVPGFD